MGTIGLQVFFTLKSGHQAVGEFRVLLGNLSHQHGRHLGNAFQHFPSAVQQSRLLCLGDFRFKLEDHLMKNLEPGCRAF